MHPFADILMALRFFSRLPVPTTQREMDARAGGLAEAAPLVPIAGAIIGLFPAIVLLVANALGLPATLAAVLAIVTSLVVTGALHEDGLADCADGFGGGRTRERKLEIMRDSRIGTFGACAIALSLYLRATALGIIAARDSGLAVAVIVASAALSRAACLLPLVILPPARADGAGAAMQPTPQRVAMAVALAVGLAFAVLVSVSGLARIAIAVGLGAIVAWAMCALAKRQIQGQTGDVAGATQQIVEIMIYLTFAAA